jgi:hypothetical protein
MVILILILILILSLSLSLFFLSNFFCFSKPCVFCLGNHTKVEQNKGNPPVKWTKVDRFVNRLTIGIFLLQLSLILGLGIGGNFWARDIAPNVRFTHSYHRTQIFTFLQSFVSLKDFILSKVKYLKNDIL